MKKVAVDNLEQLTNALKEYDDKNVWILFSAEKGVCSIEDRGKSWCSDCNDASPVIDKLINAGNISDDNVLISVSVGGRNESVTFISTFILK